MQQSPARQERSPQAQAPTPAKAWPEQPPLSPSGGSPSGGPPPAPAAAPRKRRRHPGRVALISVIVLLVVLVIADRVGNAIAENEFATQAQQSGLPVKPKVDITGFPFLTQLAAGDFNKINITAQNVPAGPLSISSINATATGVRPTSMNSATVDHIAGTGLVTFDALASAGSGGSGGSGGPGGSGLFSMTKAGPDQVQISAGPLTENAKVVKTAPNTISVQVVNDGDLLSGILSSFGSFSFTIPKLPGGMQITNLQVTTQGLSISFAASNASLSQ